MLSEKPFLRRWLPYIATAYFLIILFSLAWYWLEFEDRPFTTLVLLGPRWVAALPLFPIAGLAVAQRSGWAMGIALLTAIGIGGPLMGGRPNVGLRGSTTPAQFRVMTWNGGNAQSTEAFRNFQAESQPDIILIQECPEILKESDFPKNWILCGGERGLRVATRYPCRCQDSLPATRLALPGAAGHYQIETPVGAVAIYNVHLPTPRPGIEATIRNKFSNFDELRAILPLQAEASKIVREWVAEPPGLFLVAGDFNMPVEMRLYRRDWGSFQNAFSESGMGWGGTKMTAWHSVRIDHILSGPPFQTERCFVGPDLGSDHRPVIADLTLGARQ